MNLRTLGSLGSLLWLGAGCHPDADKQAQQAAAQQLAQHAKALRDTATVPGLHTLILTEYRREEYAQARADLALLGRRYPHALVYEQLRPLKGRLDSLAAGQQQRAATRQQRRPAKAAPLAWQVAEYPDEFGKPSGRFYLTNTAIQQGTFTTIDAADKPLVVKLEADSSTALHLVLYDYVPTVAHTTTAQHHRHFRRLHRHAAPETTTTYTLATDYATMHRYRVAQPTHYRVRVRRADGQIFTLTATNPLDRLTFAPADSRTLHDCLLLGGEVSFIVSPTDAPATYRFTIANADQYEAAYYRLLRR